MNDRKLNKAITKADTFDNVVSSIDTLSDETVIGVKYNILRSLVIIILVGSVYLSVQAITLELLKLWTSF